MREDTTQTGGYRKQAGANRSYSMVTGQTKHRVWGEDLQGYTAASTPGCPIFLVRVSALTRSAGVSGVPGVSSVAPHPIVYARPCPCLCGEKHNSPAHGWAEIPLKSLLPGPQAQATLPLPSDSEQRGKIHLPTVANPGRSPPMQAALLSPPLWMEHHQIPL